MSSRRLDDLSRVEKSRVAIGAVVRFVVTFAAVLAVYYLLPLQGAAGIAEAVLRSGIATVLFGVVVWWQLRQVLRADRPGLRAVSGVALVVPLFLCAFAAVYLMLSGASSANFNEQLTRTDALYFSIVIFGTVGFGDIVPISNGARLVVSAQILCDLVFVAVVLRLFLMAVRMSGRAPSRPEIDGH